MFCCGALRGPWGFQTLATSCKSLLWFWSPRVSVWDCFKLLMHLNSDSKHRWDLIKLSCILPLFALQCLPTFISGSMHGILGLLFFFSFLLVSKQKPTNTPWFIGIIPLSFGYFFCNLVLKQRRNSRIQLLAYRAGFTLHFLILDLYSQCGMLEPFIILSPLQPEHKHVCAYKYPGYIRLQHPSGGLLHAGYYMQRTQESNSQSDA